VLREFGQGTDEREWLRIFTPQANALGADANELAADLFGHFVGGRLVVHKKHFVRLHRFGGNDTPQVASLGARAAVDALEERRDAKSFQGFDDGFARRGRVEVERQAPRDPRITSGRRVYFSIPIMNPHLLY